MTPMDEEGLQKLLGELLAANRATQANMDAIRQQFPIQPSNVADSIPSWEQLEEGGLSPPNPEEGEGESFKEQLETQGIQTGGGGAGLIKDIVAGRVSGSELELFVGSGVLTHPGKGHYEIEFTGEIVPQILLALPFGFESPLEVVGNIFTSGGAFGANFHTWFKEELENLNFYFAAIQFS